MNVQLVGSGPAAEAVEAALADVDVVPSRGGIGAIEAADFAVVVGGADDAAFGRANDGALSGETPWLAVEIGGVGGVPLADLDAAVSGFPPGGACYNCLRQRVESNLGAEEPAAKATGSRSVVRLAGATAGAEAVAILSGEESRVLGGVVEFPHAERRLLPVPGCACQGSGERPLERGYEAVDLEEAVARAEATVDDRVGPVASIGEAESFPAPYYLANTADTTVFSDVRAAEHAAGVHPDWNAAFMKAVGEALERYAAGVYREADLEYASPADLDDAVPPAAFAGADADAPDGESMVELPWVRGIDLATGEPVRLPAGAVHFPPPGDRHVPSITTGLGLGCSVDDAIVAGLTEGIERDATMLSWYSTFEPLALSVDDEAVGTLARRAASEGLEVTTLLVSQDVDLPVVACAVHRDGEWPRFAIGSAASLDPVDAAHGALCEALQNWMELRSAGREGREELPGAIAEYASFPDRVADYVDVDDPIPARAVGPEELPSGHERVDALVDRVTEAGLSAYAVELTTRDLAAAGFAAARTLVPAAQPLFTSTPTFGERAESVPRALGFEPRLDRALHPYP